jgi:preprotein translocase subunit SecE
MDWFACNMPLQVTAVTSSGLPDQAAFKGADHHIWSCIRITAGLPAEGVRVMAAKTNPFTFFQQVRSETSKVAWPSRRETMITTLMVFVMVIFAAAFFFVVDQLLGWGVGALLALGS